MQIKSILRFHLTQSEWLSVKNQKIINQDSKDVWKVPRPTVVGMQTSTTIVEDSAEIPRRSENRPALRPSHPTPRNLPK